jgi:hypothetical protein
MGPSFVRRLGRRYWRGRPRLVDCPGTWGAYPRGDKLESRGGSVSASTPLSRSQRPIAASQREYASGGHRQQPLLWSRSAVKQIQVSPPSRAHIRRDARCPPARIQSLPQAPIPPDAEPPASYDASTAVAPLRRGPTEAQEAPSHAARSRRRAVRPGAARSRCLHLPGCSSQRHPRPAGMRRPPATG